MSKATPLNIFTISMAIPTVLSILIISKNGSSETMLRISPYISAKMAQKPHTPMMSVATF